MEIIKLYNGEQVTVWTSAKEFLRNEPILTEEGEEGTGTTLIPVQFEWKMWIHFIHTGAAAEFLVAIANDKEQRASAVVLKGAEWKITSIMGAAAKIVQAIFPEANFRERRSILLNIGKAAYRILGEFNQKTTWDDKRKHLGIKMTIDPYQPLLDVEWIEDRMEELAC